MNGITIYEYDALVEEGGNAALPKGVHYVPRRIFKWLEDRALCASERDVAGWLRLTQRNGRRAIQATRFVGVIQAPGDFHIEILPKVAKLAPEEHASARRVLLDMLRCLGQFRHLRTFDADVASTSMPLFEVFIGEFLRSVQQIVKRGIRSDYAIRQDNLPILRGKLHVSSHVRTNIARRDRFFSQFDEFTPDRPENRLIHTALRRVLLWTRSPSHQRLARELSFVFADVSVSLQPTVDLGRVRLDRGMETYVPAMAWTRLILRGDSPLTSHGTASAPSLLFPMDAVFEAFVSRSLRKQLSPTLHLREQIQSMALVSHQSRDWFRLKPDLLVRGKDGNRLVLDTKWKLLDASRSTAKQKYGIDQSDFYQLHAYGHNYLAGKGDVVLIYPSTATFSVALPVFDFSRSPGLRLWALPFCLRSRKLQLPPCDSLARFFSVP